MNKLIELNIDDSSTVYIEVPEDSSKIKNISKANEVVKKIEKSFDSIIKGFVKRICISLYNSLSAIDEKESIPDKAVVEMGLQFNLEGDIYIVKSSSQSSIKVTFEWYKKDK